MSKASPRLPKRIETRRLVLRPFELGDVDDVLAYASDPEWARFLPGVPQPYERKHAEQFVARQILSDWSASPTWAMEFDGHVRGGIGFQMQPANWLAILGYSLGRAHWGKGLTTEAAQAVIDAAFVSWPDLNRVEASADARNAASLRVMEKVGMQREALLRQHRLHRGELVDSAICGLLREEWEQSPHIP